MKVTLALNKLLILYSCKWCGVKSANSWTFPAFLTPFNGALWSLRFTSLRERKLDPTMLGEPYLVIPFYYVEIVWVRLSVWLEMPTSWYPDFKNVFLTSCFDEALCILNRQEDKSYFKGETVQYQEKFLLQLMHPCKIWNVRGNTTTQKYLGVVSVSGSHWHWTNEVHVHVLGE